MQKLKYDKKKYLLSYFNQEPVRLIYNFKRILAHIFFTDIIP